MFHPRFASFFALAAGAATFATGCAGAPDSLPEDGSEAAIETATAQQALSVSPIPSGTTVSIFARADNQYVCAESGGASPLIANRAAVGGWEQFQFIDLGNSNVALRALDNGTYVCAENGGASPLIANRTAVGAWETFRWEDLGGGDFALKSAANGRYVAAENGGASALIANRTAIGAWETFHWEPATTMGKFFRNPGGAKPILSYNRGVGTVPQSCGSAQYDAGLCYPYCAGGYTGVGPVCWGQCPSGYRDDGASCFRDTSIINANTSSCPWYDACGVTLAKGCSSCPGGYTNDGCTCRRDASIVWKSSYGRGAGTTPVICPPGQVNEAGLCYAPCSTGYKGVGSVCWIDKIDQAFCDTLYDPNIARSAANGNVTMSFGIGVGVSAVSTAGVETGIVYGQLGEYGCYTSTCSGVVTDVGINAWGAVGLYNSFASFTSDDAVSVFKGVSVAFAGFQTAQVIDNGQLVGTTDQVSLGVGLSPIQVGAQTCTTSVLRRH